PVNGGSTDTHGNVSVEVNLDVDTVRAVAPGAQVLDYEIANGGDLQGIGTDFATVTNQVVSDGKAKIMSMSYGLCDVPTIGGQSFLSPSDRQAAEQAFAAAAAAGVSVFVASGDGAAYSCQHFVPPDIQVTGTWPGDSPSVISVGGTFLAVRKDGSYLEEFPWANPITRWGGGG